MSERSKIFVWLCVLFVAHSPVYGQQVSIARIDAMTNNPQPYLMRNWKSVARGYDSLVFKTGAVGNYFPLTTVYGSTVNYPSSQSFRIKSYVGSPGEGGEAINCLPAVIGAELVGIDKNNQNGVDWVSMCKEWFNTSLSEQVYLNGPGETSGNDWWYETMPNVFFYQIYDLNPAVPEFVSQSSVVAQRWLQAVRSMGGSTVPWSIPNMDHRAWNLSTMSPQDVGVHEPEASGAIAWILYQAYLKSGNEKYREGAELAMEFLNAQTVDPSYELQLSYGAYTAARMNAEIGTSYDLKKIFSWCFDIGPLRSWGATVGTWGGYECSGLIGENQQYYPSYAFLMNTLNQIGALAPIARYNDRYASAIGKWILNAATSMRLFYPKYLPAVNQDTNSWSPAYDPNSYIGYEAMRQSRGPAAPFATGDAVENNWAQTDLALYGSSHVGYAAAVIDTTNVTRVLRLNMLATDFGHAPAYPTYLYYNPYDSVITLSIDVGNTNVDLYDCVSNAFLKTNVNNQSTIDIPAATARVIVLVPSGGTVTYDQEKMLVDNVVIDYYSGQVVSNHRPRIKSLAALWDTVIMNTAQNIFCTADDIDGDSLSYQWSVSGGSLTGSGAQISWLAPDSEKTCWIICTVKDHHNGESSDTISIESVQSINHPPTIKKMKATPRKVNVNAAAVVTCDATDSDNDSLIYVWASGEGSFTGSGSSVEWNSTSTAGLFWLICTVSDQQGGLAHDSILVEVSDYSTYTQGNILASYMFNGNTDDGSGNNRNGTSSNVLLVVDRHGNPGSAALFNGQNSSIRIPYDDGLNVQNAISINFWMKVGVLYDREQYPISHGNWQNRWKVSVSNNHLRWTVKTSAGVKDLDSETPLLIDSVYNVTVQYGSGAMELYLNGALDALSPMSGAIQKTTYDLTIGQSLPGDNNYNFNGILDDIRLFDYVLSPSEITQYAAVATSVKDPSSSAVPADYVLGSYPNPFNPSTVIQFGIPEKSRVTVTMYDMLGREVARLVDGELPGGMYNRVWNAGTYSSGIYFCVLRANNKILTKKLLLVR